MLCLISIWIVVLSLRSLPGMCARENFARAELLYLERVIGGEREFQISWMQKQLPQTQIDIVLIFLILLTGTHYI